MEQKLPNNLEVGERIRKIREDLNMNRETFSEMIDVSDVFLGQIERGERSLSLKTLCRIVSFTGASTDYILLGNAETNSTIDKIVRILRKSFKTKDIITYIEDILFWIITGLILLYSIFTFNNGEVRLFMFLGLGFGLIFYMLTFSKMIIAIFVFLLTAIKKTIHQIIKICYHSFFQSEH